MSKVGLVKIRDENYKQAIIDSLKLINYNFPKSAKEIVIKPNMCYYWDYTTGTTTDPLFVGKLIELLRENISSNVKISIVESDASAMKCRYAFNILGYEDLAQQYDVPLINLTKEKSDKETIKIGGKRICISVPRILKNADLTINVPKLRYSMKKIEITCALKNIFGCIPYPKKYKYHPILTETIVAANKLMKFDLHILDGNIVAGLGTRKIKLIMSSQDAVSLDCVASSIAGVDPKSIKYIQMAAEEGVGEIKFITNGAPWEYFGSIYPRKGIKDKVVSVAFEMIQLLKLENRLMLNL